MKKLLLFAILALSTVSFTAQVLEADTFNTYTVGNLGTDVTGTTPGQGGMSTLGGTNADYQIVTIDAAHGKSLQVTTGATAVGTASNRTVLKLAGLDTAWSTRTPGNNIVKGSLEIYTGTSLGKNYMTSRIFGQSGTSLVGIVGVRYNSDTKTMEGFANLTPAGGGASGFYGITFTGGAVIPANTWIAVTYTYDTVAGAITYNFGGVSTTLAITGYVVTPGLSPVQHRVEGLVVPAGTNPVTPGNTASTTAAVDNINITALSTLGTSEVKNDKIAIGIYPNPTADILYIKTTEKLKSVSVFDMAGRKMDIRIDGKSLDVRSLQTGTYLISIESANGKTSEKFIKK